MGTHLPLGKLHAGPQSDILWNFLNLGAYNLRKAYVNFSFTKPNTEYLEMNYWFCLAVLWNNLATQAKRT